MPMTVNRSKSKPEKKFQYGGRLFSETGGNNISRGSRYLVKIWSANRFWPL